MAEVDAAAHEASAAESYPVAFSDAGYEIDMRTPFEKISIAEAEYKKFAHLLFF